MAFYRQFKQILDPAALLAIGNAVTAYRSGHTDAMGQRRYKLYDFLASDLPAEKQLGSTILTFFWTSVIPEIYRKLKGHEPMLLLRICTLRHQALQVDDTYVPWHLDANFFGFGTPFLTIWVPFQDVGETRPGLEVALPEQPIPDEAIAERWRKVVPDEMGRTVLPDASLGDLYGDVPYRREVPRLGRGDALVFDQFVLHRTQILPTAVETRLAIEFRVTSTKEFPTDRSWDFHRDDVVSFRDPQTGSIRFTSMADIFA